MPNLSKVQEEPGKTVIPASVTSLNGETGAVNITAGANINVTPAGQNIAIAYAGGGNASALVTANGFTLKQDASGNLGIYNTPGVEIGFFESTTNGLKLHWLTSTGTEGMDIGLDASGNLGIYNSSGVEMASFDVHGKLLFNTVDFTFNGNSIGDDGYGDFEIQRNAVFANAIYFQNPNGGLIAKYLGVNTVGLGVPAIYASYSQTNKNAAVTNAINYTPPAAAGTYRLTFSIDVRVATTDNFHLVATWKDAAGTARSQTLGGSDSAGNALVAGAITNTIGVGTYSGSILFQIDNSATAITLSTVGTFTTVTYDFAATLEQLA